MIVFAVTAIRRGGARRAGRLLVLIMIAGGLLLAIFSALGSVKFLDERAALQQYDTERFSAQRTGIDLATQKPLGIGPGQFEVVSPLSTHSIYVRILAEQGVLGFMVVLALLLSHAAVSHPKCARRPIDLRDRLGGATRILGRDARQQLCGRHRPLAAPVADRPADLAGVDAVHPTR